MSPGGGIDKLSRDAHSLCDLADAPFKQIPHAELAPDLLHVQGAAFGSEVRVPRDHEQSAHPRQCRDDLRHDAINGKHDAGIQVLNTGPRAGSLYPHGAIACD